MQNETKTCLKWWAKKRRLKRLSWCPPYVKSPISDLNLPYLSSEEFS